jgi:hypothetical protein
MIAAQLERGLEVLLVAGADEAVDAVGRDDQVDIGELVEIADLARELELDADIAAARLQHHQQGAALGAAEAVTGGAHDLAVEVEVDLVPIGELAGDRCIGLRVVVHEIVEGLVREHHTEAERVVRAIALVDGHVVIGEALLHQEREVETARAAADDDDLHAAASCMRTVRGNSLRPTPP